MNAIRSDYACAQSAPLHSAAKHHLLLPRLAGVDKGSLVRLPRSTRTVGWGFPSSTTTGGPGSCSKFASFGRIRACRMLQSGRGRRRRTGTPRSFHRRCEFQTPFPKSPQKKSQIPVGSRAAATTERSTTRGPGGTLASRRPLAPVRLSPRGRHARSFPTEEEPSLRRMRCAARGYYYSATVSPDPPSSSGKSLSFGRPSFIGSTVDS